MPGWHSRTSALSRTPPPHKISIQPWVEKFSQLKPRLFEAKQEIRKLAHGDDTEIARNKLRYLRCRTCLSNCWTVAFIARSRTVFKHCSSLCFEGKKKGREREKKPVHFFLSRGLLRVCGCGRCERHGPEFWGGSNAGRPLWRGIRGSTSHAEETLSTRTFLPAPCCKPRFSSGEMLLRGRAPIWRWRHRSGGAAAWSKTQCIYL